ncbi:MAG: hypothetical protein COB20_08870 [SAR86 cluster bacterium]|uniref:DUF4440 domain-containing protein n=1 Tax=SAR86 cluster bacterium TaxID=2030880 RepID=A0A2A4X3H8_9GAMM|nr:MAG: hypothetical protein COB20_08870 [SAR86 cluster bacterium]
MEARAALERFLAAWNSADNSAVQKTVNYPHITHSPMGLIVANEPEQFITDFDALKQQSWVRSTFDKITPRQSSDQKVNFEVEYSRLNTAGEVISRGYVFYVVTNNEGHWGMQYRAPGQLTLESGEAALENARQAAIALVDEFFVAFNAADNAALLRVNHVPQIMLSAGQFILAADVSSPIVTMSFERMRERENWHSSELGDFEIVNVSENQVIVELSFERFNPSFEHYLTGPAVWVLSKREENWGVEFRSLMSPTRHLQ